MPNQPAISQGFDEGSRVNMGSSIYLWSACMTLDRAREIIRQQISFGSGYNRNAVRLLLGEIQREYGLQAGDQLIRELELEAVFGLRPGTDFTRVGR